MKIAVLSGKGGTGKTTVAASLAASLPACQYIDCDVEEPNGYIFLSPKLTDTVPVYVPIPEVDATKCSGCGSCAQVCQFNALAVVKGRYLYFRKFVTTVSLPACLSGGCHIRDRQGNRCDRG